MTFEGQLIITDGTDELDLISIAPGIHLNSWRPAIAQYKGAGVVRNNPQATGSRLVDKHFANANEVFDLKVDDLDRNTLIRRMQKILTMLEKATDYFTTDWQDTVVYLVAQAECEDNPRYAIVANYAIPELGNPYDQPFLTPGNPLFDQIMLGVERRHWQSTVPGTGTASQISGTVSFDGRTLGRAATTSNEVFITNKHPRANLTDIYVDDGGAFGSNLLDAALPYDLLPGTPANSDAVYFGSDTGVTDSGPFNSLVFDLSTGATLTNGNWEYWNGGAWAVLGVHRDGTSELANTGVNVIVWDSPASWAATSVNGVTAFWIRFLVVTAGGGPVPPTQQNRDPYVATLPYVELASTVVSGEIPALLDLKTYGQSANLAAASDANAHHLFVGLRSVTRGDDYTAYINISDEQNASGITVSADTETTFVSDVDAPSGRLARYNPTGASGFADRVTIAWSAALAAEYRGQFRLYVRLNPDGNTTEFTVRCQLRLGGSPSNPVNVLTTDTITINATTTEGVIFLDFGRITLPPTWSRANPTAVSDFELVIQATADNGTDNLDFFDIILMPTDEWGGFFSVVNVAESETEVIYSINDGTYLNVSGTFPGDGTIRSILAGESDDLGDVFFTAVTNGNPILQTGLQQRLWFFAPWQVTSTDPRTWKNFTASIEAQRAQRYLTMRGDQ